MYFEDMTEIDGWTQDGKAYWVGYLDINHPYTTGEVPAGFISKLLAMPRAIPVAISAGWHGCPLCPKQKDNMGNWISPRIRKHNEHAWWLGSMELGIYSIDKTKIYLMPDLITHYIEQHHYLPPQEVIDAVMSY